jgi:cellulose synthase/poly-beta-1,6-N-acetylglucosamine synthase-like glycosyltransferase
MTTVLPQPWNVVVLAIEVFLFVYFICVNGYYLFTGVIALLQLPAFVKIHLADPVRRSNSTLDQPVSILVPAFNEREIIVASLESILALDYGNFEVIVINDGSSDDTMELLDTAFDLEPYEGIYRVEVATQEIVEVYQSARYPALRVVDKRNGGKGDALNAGMNLARFPLVFTADADSFYHPQTLQWMILPFQKEPRTVAVGGAIAVGLPEREKRGGGLRATLPSKLIQRFQVLEYLRAFLATRMGFAPLNGLGIISGACGLWKREVLVGCGGFRVDTIWEDMEMTLRVHHFCIATGRPYRIGFTPYPVCWTDVPASLGVLYKQRRGWHRHLSESMMIHRRMLFGSATAFSWITMPYLFFFEWLAPVVILFGITFMAVGAWLGFLDWHSQWWLTVLVFVLALLGSLAGMLLDAISYTSYGLNDTWALFGDAFLENFGYRQFVLAANFMGLMTWLFRTPVRGTRSAPGLFVKAWRAPSPGNGPASRRAMKIE